MILQNLTKAIREQNYYAVVLEFLIVIAGVVIGFQITAWNELSKDKAREEAYLDRLTSEFQVIYQEANELAVTTHSWADDLRVLREVTASQELPDNLTAIRSAINNYSYVSYSPPPGGSAALNELISAGDMSILSEDQLRVALSNFSAQLEEHRYSDIRFGRDMSIHTQPLWRLITAFQTQPTENLSEDALSLLQSEQVRVAAEAVLQISTASALQHERTATHAANVLTSLQH